MPQALSAPFPWFGGKSRAADLVWSRFGDVPNYVEPFFGSGAILLSRPTAPKVETVNDKDGFVCLAPQTRLLRSDLTWSMADSVMVGDELYGFDESNGDPRGGLRAPTSYRHWRPTAITDIQSVMKPSYRLTFADGTSVIASEDHQWLIGSHRTGGRGWRWGTTKALIANRRTQCSWLLKVAPVVERDNTWDAGWMGGFFDGEGHITQGSGWHLGVSQNAGQALQRARAWLTAHGFETSVQTRRRCAFLRINGGKSESLRFLMLTRPERLIVAMRRKIAAGHVSLYGRDHQVAQLVRKEFVGPMRVLAIATTTRTFIAEGLASHNCNFWRAIQAGPEVVAQYADWPVNENDQHARHVWLVGQRAALTTRLEGDPHYFDPKIAGWWVWGICCWIGSGWCSGNGPWQVDDAGQLVHLWDAGQGVHRQLVHLGNAGQGVQQWFAALADRLRYVRVCCGDWRRVCGPTPTAKQGLTGVLLDPPYADTAGRDGELYAVDSEIVAHSVREWAIAHGDDPLLRIALCGYEGEHDMPAGWTMMGWKARGGYGSQGEGIGRANARRERIWFSKFCLQSGLPFDDESDHSGSKLE